MSRPSFQFYPGDWQKNANLRRCTPAARGVWVDVLCLMHDAAEYGVLRWPLKDIATAAGASMALLRELVAKGVLKGADEGADVYVYRPRHAGKEGESVVLAAPDGGPIWYSSRFVRDEYVRTRRGGSTRFDTDRQPESRSPKGGLGTPVGDGPSTSSSSSSKPKGLGGADAPPVDNSLDQGPEGSRALWLQAGEWLVNNGCTQGDAAAFMRTLAKDYPGLAAEVLQEAIKTASPTNAKAWTVGVAKRMHMARVKTMTVPSDAAAQSQAMLAERAAIWATATLPPKDLRSRLGSRAINPPAEASDGG